jgi:CMP-N-acetylneuraminic acid synthetase
VKEGGSVSVCALLLGREGSVGFPGKNVHEVEGRPLMAYPILAAQDSKTVDCIFVSTDSDAIATIARNMGVTVIERPAHLASPEALGEDAYAHGYEVIKQQLACSGAAPELMVLLFCNAPTVTGALIDDGVEVLRSHPDLDSAVSVSRYNMWSPLRARKINEDGLLEPFVPFEVFGDPATLNCDRDSQGDVWFADMGVSVVRPRCLENLRDGVLPQRWMGRRIHPLKQTAGLDVDYAWQVPQAAEWIRTFDRRG